MDHSERDTKADHALIMSALASLTKNKRLKRELMERVREIDQEVNPHLYYPDM